MPTQHRGSWPSPEKPCYCGPILWPNIVGGCDSNQCHICFAWWVAATGQHTWPSTHHLQKSSPFVQLHQTIEAKWLPRYFLHDPITLSGFPNDPELICNEFKSSQHICLWVTFVPAQSQVVHVPKHVLTAYSGGMLLTAALCWCVPATRFSHHTGVELYNTSTACRPLSPPADKSHIRLPEVAILPAQLTFCCCWALSWGGRGIRFVF